jgi:hypothetical protein
MQCAVVFRGRAMRKMFLVVCFCLTGCQQPATSTSNAQVTGSTAPSGQACIATYVRVGSALALHLANMNPPARCTNNMVQLESGRPGNGLRAAGKISPAASGMGAFDPDTTNGGIASYAERLVVQIFRFDRPDASGGIQSKPLDGHTAEFKDARSLNVPSTTVVDGFQISLEGFYISDPDAPPLRIVCVIGVNETTKNSTATICRSTYKTDGAGLSAEADQIIRDDFPAIRF